MTRVFACSLFNNILSPAELDDRASLFFFLDGIKPDWDEKETADGGVWTVPVKQRGAEGKARLEAYWADVVRYFLMLEIAARLVMCHSSGCCLLLGILKPSFKRPDQECRVLVDPRDSWINRVHPGGGSHV
jgi:hypothetical protein